MVLKFMFHLLLFRLPKNNDDGTILWVSPFWIKIHTKSLERQSMWRKLNEQPGKKNISYTITIHDVS